MFITFYSYKGGVGRTTALANVACLLALDPEHPQKVLVWDFDLEAPGLHRIFPPREPQRYGFVDLAYMYTESGSMPSVDSFIYQSEIKGIDVLPAGIVDRAYCSKLQQLNWPGFFSENTEESFFGMLVDSIKALRRYDYVLIDSRTGLSDAAGICTEVLPDQLVFLFRLTAQNADGLEHLVPTVRSQLNARRKKDVPIVPVASSVITTNLSAIQKLRKRFQELFGVPELPYIRFDMDLIAEEGLLCRTDRKHDRWPKPPVVNDYANLCNVIRSRNEADVRTMSKQVSAYVNAGDYASAAPLVTSVLVRMPTLGAMWRTFRFMHRIKAISDTECDSILDSILKNDPDNSYAHEWRAIRLLEEAEDAHSPEVEEAIREFDKAIRLAPERRELLRLVATVASSRGEFKKALSDTKKARDGEPANVQASLDIAYYNVRLGGPYLAVAAEELASVVDRSSFHVRLWLAYLYAFLGKEDEARELLAKNIGEARDIDEDLEPFPPGISEAHIDLMAGQVDQTVNRAIEELNATGRGRRTKLQTDNWIELLICAGDFEKAISFLQGAKGLKHKQPLLLLSKYLGGGNGAPPKEEVLKAWSRVQGWSFFELLMARERIATKEMKPDLAKRFWIVEELIRQYEFLVGIRQRAGLGSPEDE
jgi:MinD-like ATPase involved in chromosome partitioning or flagellar assembly/tetratricopeptide (TPR) repeat protein